MPPPRTCSAKRLDTGRTCTARTVRKPPVVFNTLVGESSYRFIRALHAATAAAGLAIPMLSCSLCEPELRLIGSEASAGCIVSSAYFETLARPENRAFVERWKRRFGRDGAISVDAMSTFVSVTVAPLIAAPVGSLTVPRISPVLRLWEKAGKATNISRHAATRQRIKLFMEFLRR